MSVITVNIKKVNKNAKIPTRGTSQSAGYDLYACLESDKMTILPHETKKVPTGISIELPDNTFGAIFARSGISLKKNLRPANCVAVIDSDYRGEYIVLLHNDSNIVQEIENFERIAQLVIMPYIPVNFCEVNKLSDTERGENKFGSTGDK